MILQKTVLAICAAGSLFVLLGFSDMQLRTAKQEAFVTVEAGAFDRHETVVTFQLPASLRVSPYELRGSSGPGLAVQVDSSRRASFVLPELKAGTSITYRLVNSRAAVPMVTVRKEGKKIRLGTLKRRVLDFQMEGELPSPEVKPIFLRGGYIHPVFAPSGRVVTDDYPSDHYHHHGIWAAWTKTEFEGRKPDFWNMDDSSGKVEFVSVDDTWEGAVHGGFRSRQDYVDLSGSEAKRVLNETWDVRVYFVGQGRKRYSMFDLNTIQECATRSPLILSEYRYGGVGFRGHRDWKDKSKIAFLTSEGKDRGDGNATRARWCHIGGPVDGQEVGVAILDHPGNFRAPQPMRINPDDPFFNYAPSQLGQFEIAPGFLYTSAYRFVVADGPADKLEIDRLWNDYANPPQVTITYR